MKKSCNNDKLAMYFDFCSDFYSFVFLWLLKRKGVGTKKEVHKFEKVVALLVGKRKKIFHPHDQSDFQFDRTIFSWNF